MKDRKKALLFSAVANYGSVIISVIVGLISIPLGLRYFGPILYGVWFIIRSIIAYLRISDFGVGLSTLTFIAQTSEPSHHRVILSRSIKLLLWVSISFIIILLIVNFSFPKWIGLLGKIPSNLKKEAATATLAIVIIILVQLPTTIFTAAFSGLQQVYWNRMYDLFRSIIRLGALLMTVLVSGSLLTLAIFTGIGSLLIGIVSGAHLFVAHPEVRPRVREIVANSPSSRLLFTSGIRFLALQIAILIIWNTDNLIISHYLGPEIVTPYAVTFKLFQMGLTIISASIIALWPMYGQALDKGDWNWIQQVYNRSIYLQTVGGGLIWVGGIIFSKIIINIWVGPVGYGGLLVAFALGGYVYISSFGGSNSSLINGLNPTNIVVIFGLTEAALNLGISLALVRSFGIGGIALGTFIASIAVNSWFGPLYIRNRTEKKVELKIIPILKHFCFVVIPCVISSIIVALYVQIGRMQITTGVIIIMFYLLLSWRLMPTDLRSTVRNALLKLLSRLNPQRSSK